MPRQFDVVIERDAEGFYPNFRTSQVFRQLNLAESVKATQRSSPQN